MQPEADARDKWCSGSPIFRPMNTRSLKSRPHLGRAPLAPSARSGPPRPSPHQAAARALHTAKSRKMGL